MFTQLWIRYTTYYSQWDVNYEWVTRGQISYVLSCSYLDFESVGFLICEMGVATLPCFWFGAVLRSKEILRVAVHCQWWSSVCMCGGGDLFFWWHFHVWDHKFHPHSSTPPAPVNPWSSSPVPSRDIMLKGLSTSAVMVKSTGCEHTSEMNFCHFLALWHWANHRTILIPFPHLWICVAILYLENWWKD